MGAVIGRVEIHIGDIFDPKRTAIVMKDWYAFKDPRQFYYGTYTLARARMQEAAEAGFADGKGFPKLTLIYNRARLAVITKELMEIVSGAEALK